MIISDKQAELAARCLHTTEDRGGTREGGAVTSAVSPDLLARVNEVLADVPETRSERVAQAREDLADGVCSAEDIAHKMILRAISDSLR